MKLSRREERMMAQHREKVAYEALRKASKAKEDDAQAAKIREYQAQYAQDNRVFADTVLRSYERRIQEDTERLAKMLVEVGELADQKRIVEMRLDEERTESRKLREKVAALEEQVAGLSEALALLGGQV